ncbi:hypothetical protein BD309DRAFT_242059 [Dichomitus squalens]|uniref:Cyclin N-terminal domain-containing protein n=1 Tax=Dichomitus squalens TaxID=114155 RepID=A0A4Q9Q225_9APHY|nr:hypothetical protein BD309DRAFT_242059 [Dichomitus squalens]TBU61267.1 hypothetical protein BD310DRAFT_904818 [Dichomitus squalens]
MSFVFTLTTTPAAAFSSTSSGASPLNMNEPTSLVPLAHLDEKVVEMVSTQVNFGVIDYFIDMLVNTVARAVIASRYKAAMEMKTLLVMQHVCTFITCGALDTRTILTAIVYLSEIRLSAYDMGDRVCERLAIGALMLAHKSINEPSYRSEQWLQLVRMVFGQQFTIKDLTRIEREVLSALDWKVMPTNTAILAHYDVFMRYARRDREPSAVPKTAAVPARTERAERSYPVPEPAPATNPAAAIPDLMYPDYSSDGYSSDSDDSSEIITPPSAGPSAYASGHTHTGRVGATPSRKNRSSPYPYPRPSRRTSSQNHGSPVCERNDHYRVRRDASLIEAKVRYYAADHGTVLRESGSPRYVPYSPSQPWNRRDRYDPAPTPPPPSTTWKSYWPEDRPHAAHRRGEEHPWRRYQNWKSTMPGVSANDKWGTFGLFRQ